MNKPVEIWIQIPAQYLIGARVEVICKTINEAWVNSKH
jgi:hypothetical protein